MASVIRILIAEDQRLIREGLAALLGPEPGLEVIGGADDGIDAVQTCLSLKPDVVLMDLSMPRMDGIEAIRQIRRQRSDARILVLTVTESEETVAEALRAGADGYILKHVGREELIEAINAALEGRTFFSAGVSEDAVRRYLTRAGNGGTGTPLTARERQILRLITEGYRNREIAAHLFISVKTVENHRANLMRKLDLHNAAELTAYAIKHQLV